MHVAPPCCTLSAREITFLLATIKLTTSCTAVSHAAITGSMLDGVMANNAVGLAFGGGLQDMKKQAQGRTYYMHCSSRMEADEWKNAIANNVRALPQERSKLANCAVLCRFVPFVPFVPTASIQLGSPFIK